MIARALYAIAGVSALYMAVTPLFSNAPRRPVWNDALFLVGALSLLAAGLALHRKAQTRSALVGSGLVVLVYGYWFVVRVLAVSLGATVQPRLISALPTSFDRWRGMLDLPFAFCLIASALLSLLVALRSGNSGHTAANDA